MTPCDRRARRQVMDTIVQTWPSINTTYQHLDPVTVSHPRAKRAAWHIPSASRASRLRSTLHQLNGWGGWPKPCSLYLHSPYYPSPGPLLGRCWQFAPYRASVYEGFFLITKGEIKVVLYPSYQSEHYKKWEISMPIPHDVRHWEGYTVCDILVKTCLTWI